MLAVLVDGRICFCVREIGGEAVHDITRTFSERGDLAHLALFLWATGASGLLVWTLRELPRRIDVSTIPSTRSLD